MALTESGHTPSSTYRVQLHGKFKFSDLGSLAPYFENLGVSDLYLSPIFASVPGSQHGYDVTDFSEVNPELGGAREFSRVAARLRSHGCSVILDFVPNHMGIEGALNVRWREVLENGPGSRYAEFFDIAWKAEPGEDHPRVLVPILGDHYGKVLERGEITLVCEDGFSLRYQKATFPLRPESYAPILEDLAAEIPFMPQDLREIAAGFAAAPPAAEAAHAGPPGPDGSMRVLKGRLASALSSSPALAQRLSDRLALLNGTPGNPGSFDALHAIIERQHYRLVRWQSGAHEINYRRFFAIDTLVGVHMENPDVFRECHALVGRLLANGEVRGLRIDHVDGLRQPEDYLRQLQSLSREDRNRPLYVLAEKILAAGESIPEAWPIHGTTGYEFISDLASLLVDPSGAAAADAAYARSTGDSLDYAALVIRCKRLIIAEMFANAVSNLGADLVAIVAGDRRWRDLTRHELTTAVSELAAHLGVYRTYRRRVDPVVAPDPAAVEDACRRAVAGNPRSDSQAFEFLRDLLIGAYPAADASPEYRGRILDWVLTFQQYTGAIMAKSVEDTAFYNYNRFIGLNEVGCDPGTFGGGTDAFHASNGRRLATCPLTLLASSTHDSKFSEDARARLYALSEVMPEWESWLAAFRRSAARHLVEVDGAPAPDALDQYRFFQVLLAAWPLSEAEVDEAFRARLREHVRKCVDEAKRHTSIMNRNEPYVLACERFMDSVTTEASGGDFLAAFRPCADWIARLGMVNALTQLVLKCTVPGVPDVYQGTETWAFNLVDPDNRRPVDHAAHAATLDRVADEAPSRLLEAWRDGGIKLRVTRDLLRLRRELPEVFSSGSYLGLAAQGAFAANVVSFARAHGSETVVVVVPRLTARLGTPPTGPVWDDTILRDLPPSAGWQDVVTRRSFPGHEPLFLRTVLAELPFAVLRSRELPHAN
jgi:(1->4)-alpha-D-glucan 1-alpha-D-glucosylmutase